MIRIQLFGTPSLRGPSGPLSGRAAQPRRLALLALLVTEHPRPVSRDRLIAYLLPDDDTERARHLLRDSLYVLRAALGEDALVASGDDLRLNAEQVGCDVWDFEEALRQARYEASVRACAGPFMAGFHLQGAAEFERWLEEERGRFARRHAQALEALANERTAAGDLPGAVAAWQDLVALDPYDSRLALRLMEALQAAGNRVGALRHAAVHATLLREEFGAEPDPEVEALAERLRSEPSPRSRAAPGGPRSEQAGAGQIPLGAKAADVEQMEAAFAASLPPADDPSNQRSEHLDPVDSSSGRPTSPPSAAGLERTTGQRNRWLGAAALLAVVSLAGAVWTLRPNDVEPERSIVVLPFVNMSPDAENEYFSDGLTEEIITRLSAVPELKVISRTSAMHYKGSRKSLRQIAGELNVAHILEGSVRQSNGRVRISAQLIDARADHHLWAENYDYALLNIFRVQEEIAQAVARALEVELREQGPRQLAKPSTRDPEAYQLYQRARYLWSTRTKEAHEQAVVYYRKALERDSSYADAYAGLADAYLTAYQLGHSDEPEEEVYSRIKWAAERALALNDESADAHTSLAIALWWQRNWPGAERELRRAIELNPGNATARGWYAVLLGGMGRLEEALQQSRLAYELDPFSVIISMTSAWACYINRDYDCAIEQYRRTLEINNAWAPAYTGMGIAFAQKGMHEAAIRAVSKGVELRPARLWPLADLAYVQALAGDVEAARESVRRSKQDGWAAFSTARAHIALGEPDSAFVWLERGSWRWPHRGIRADPALDPLRNDPRFAELVLRIDREMGLQ